jgi:hypothetical protein
MKALNTIIKTVVNPALGLSSPNKTFGLVIPVKKLDVDYFHEYDDSTDAAVHIADNVDVYLYHRLTKPEQFDVLDTQGKETRYRVTANIDLVLYSRLFREAPDYIVSKLSKVKNLVIKSRDSDSWKILANNTPKKDYNTNHDLVTINYDITYTSDKCTVETLGTGIADCHNDTQDC